MKTKQQVHHYRSLAEAHATHLAGVEGMETYYQMLRQIRKQGHAVYSTGYTTITVRRHNGFVEVTVKISAKSSDKKTVKADAVSHSHESGNPSHAHASGDSLDSRLRGSDSDGGHAHASGNPNDSEKEADRLWNLWAIERGWLQKRLLLIEKKNQETSYSSFDKYRFRDVGWWRMRFNWDLFDQFDFSRSRGVSDEVWAVIVKKHEHEMRPIQRTQPTHIVGDSSTIGKLPRYHVTYGQKRSTFIGTRRQMVAKMRYILPEKWRDFPMEVYAVDDPEKTLIPDFFSKKERDEMLLKCNARGEYYAEYLRMEQQETPCQQQSNATV